MGNFTTKLLGLVTLIKTMDKHLTEGVSGISQRLEKVGLVMGLIELIVKHGFLVTDVCTDQCKGAPSDIAKALERQDVRKMLLHAQEKLREWRAEMLGSGGVQRSEGRRTWASRVAKLRESLDELGSVASGLVTILHHFDVYHVEVKLMESFTAFINTTTKRQLPKKAARQRQKRPWELRGAPLNDALRKVADKLLPSELALLGANSADALKVQQELKGKLDAKQAMLQRVGGGEEDEGEEGEAGEEEGEAADADGGEVGEGREEAEDRKRDNRKRLAARKELLDAEAGLLDTSRHHFYRVCQYAAMLIMGGTPVAEVQAGAWQLWKNGLIGHVYTQTHQWCGPSAACR